METGLLGGGGKSTERERRTPPGVRRDHPQEDQTLEMSFEGRMGTHPEATEKGISVRGNDTGEVALDKTGEGWSLALFSSS